jgi:hypothetical protein
MTATQVPCDIFDKRTFDFQNYFDLVHPWVRVEFVADIEHLDRLGS